MLPVTPFKMSNVKCDFPIPISGPTKRWMIKSLRGKREKGVLDQVKIPKTHAMFRGKGQTNARRVVLKPFTGNCYRANSCTALCSAYNHSSNLAQLGSDSCRLIAMYFCIVCVKKGQPLRLKTKKRKENKDCSTGKRSVFAERI